MIILIWWRCITYFNFGGKSVDVFQFRRLLNNFNLRESVGIFQFWERVHVLF